MQEFPQPVHQPETQQLTQDFVHLSPVRSTLEDHYGLTGIHLRNVMDRLADLNRTRPSERATGSDALIGDITADLAPGLYANPMVSMLGFEPVVILSNEPLAKSEIPGLSRIGDFREKKIDIFRDKIFIHTADTTVNLDYDPAGNVNNIYLLCRDPREFGIAAPVFQAILDPEEWGMRGSIRMMRSNRTENYPLPEQPHPLDHMHEDLLATEVNYGSDGQVKSVASFFRAGERDFFMVHSFNHDSGQFEITYASSGTGHHYDKLTPDGLLNEQENGLVLPELTSENGTVHVTRSVSAPWAPTGTESADYAFPEKIDVVPIFDRISSFIGKEFPPASDLPQNA